jgi:hypothetical protein
MAIEAKVTGNGFFSGASTNVSSYTVSEDCTPLSPSDSSGGTGTFVINVLENPNADGTMLLYGDQIDLSDGSNGTTQGVVSNLTSLNGIVSLTADSRMFLMNTVVVAGPRNDTVSNILYYYLSLVGITSGIVIDAAIGSLVVTWPGWNNQLWLQMKKLLMTIDAEVSLVSSNVTIRAVRQRVAEVLKDTAHGWNIAQSNIAQNVDIYNYNNVRKVNSLAYPDGGWNDQTTVLQVDAGQTILQNFPVSVWLESLVQPTCVSNVNKFDNTLSAYTVTGNDGVIVSPAVWNAGGGSVVATIGADGKSIDVTIRGAAPTTLAPFRIAVSTGQSNYYSSLRILGTGVFFRKDLIRIPTGLTNVQTTTRTNLLLNPSGRLTTTAFASIGSGSIGQDAGQDTYFYTTTGGQPAGNYGLYQVLNVGTDLVGFTTYTFSCYLYGTDGTGAQDCNVYAGGSGVYSRTISTSGRNFNRVFIQFTTAASGSVLLYALNNFTTIAGNGNIVAWRDAMVEIGTNVGTYFDGNTASSGSYVSAWSGAVGNSASTNTIIQIGAANTSAIAGTTIDNEFIGDLATAMSLGLRAAQWYGGPSQTINASSVRINRTGDGGSNVYPTFNDLNAAQGANLFSDFNTAQGANTFDQFTAAQFATVANIFSNQSFGNVAGARLQYADQYYRIRTGVTGPNVISYTAERDSLFNDFNVANSVKTFDQFNNKWYAKSFIDFSLASLWA